MSRAVMSSSESPLRSKWLQRENDRFPIALTASPVWQDFLFA